MSLINIYQDYSKSAKDYAYCAKRKQEDGKILLVKGLSAAGGSITIEASADLNDIDAFWEPVDFDGDAQITADGHYTLPAANYRIRANYSLAGGSENIVLRLV